MKLIVETTKKMYLEISDSGSDQLKVKTVIDGKDKQDIVDAGTDGLDFYDNAEVHVGKLRFFK